LNFLENNVRIVGFDPFKDRASRTVRNTLSEMLRACLGRREVFSGVPAAWRQLYPQPPYAAYIRDRVDRYRAATSEALSADDSPVARAAILWRHGLYFEAHEVLEPHWQAASGEEREGLQGLIQAAGVYVHQEAGQEEASVRLACKAVDRLRRYGDAIGGCQTMGIETLVEELEEVMVSSRGGRHASR
jgi:uncharacterized protein